MKAYQRSALLVGSCFLSMIAFGGRAAAADCPVDGSLVQNSTVSEAWAFQYGTCSLQLQHGVYISTAYSQIKKTNSSCNSVGTFNWGCAQGGSPCSQSVSYTTTSMNVWVQASRPNYSLGNSSFTASGAFAVGYRCSRRTA